MWSWVLSATTAISVYLLGFKKSWVWLFALANEFLWIAYGVVTKQWGFVGFGLVYGVIYTFNWLKWYGHELQEKHW